MSGTTGVCGEQHVRVAAGLLVRLASKCCPRGVRVRASVCACRFAVLQHRTEFAVPARATVRLWRLHHRLGRRQLQPHVRRCECVTNETASNNKARAAPPRRRQQSAGVCVRTGCCGHDMAVARFQMARRSAVAVAARHERRHRKPVACAPQQVLAGDRFSATHSELKGLFIAHHAMKTPKVPATKATSPVSSSSLPFLSSSSNTHTRPVLASHAHAHAHAHAHDHAGTGQEFASGVQLS